MAWNQNFFFFFFLGITIPTKCSQMVRCRLPTSLKLPFWLSLHLSPFSQIHLTSILPFHQHHCSHLPTPTSNSPLTVCQWAFKGHVSLPVEFLPHPERINPSSKKRTTRKALFASALRCLVILSSRNNFGLQWADEKNSKRPVGFASRSRQPMLNLKLRILSRDYLEERGDMTCRCIAAQPPL